VTPISSVSQFANVLLDVKFWGELIVVDPESDGVEVGEDGDADDSDDDDDDDEDDDEDEDEDEFKDEDPVT